MAVVLWTTKKETMLHMWRTHILLACGKYTVVTTKFTVVGCQSQCTISYSHARNTWTAKLPTNMIGTKLIFVCVCARAHACVCVCAFVCCGSSNNCSMWFHVFLNVLNFCWQAVRRVEKQRAETSLVLVHCELEMHRNFDHRFPGYGKTWTEIL
jgi:hypothetical protein